MLRAEIASLSMYCGLFFDVPKRNWLIDRVGENQIKIYCMRSSLQGILMHFVLYPACPLINSVSELVFCAYLDSPSVFCRFSKCYKSFFHKEKVFSLLCLLFYFDSLHVHPRGRWNLHWLGSGNDCRDLKYWFIHNIHGTDSSIPEKSISCFDRFLDDAPEALDLAIIAAMSSEAH
jgi:hypothetical protein